MKVLGTIQIIVFYIKTDISILKNVKIRDGIFFYFLSFAEFCQMFSFK
jgi:hypothetical protein